MVYKNTIILFDLDNTLIATDSMKILVLFLIKKNYFDFFLKLPTLIYYSLIHILSNSAHNLCHNPTRCVPPILVQVLS